MSLKLSRGELQIIPTFWGVTAFDGSQKTCKLRSWIGANRHAFAVSICFKYMWRFSYSQKYSGSHSDHEKDNKAIWKQLQTVARPFGWRWALKYDKIVHHIPNTAFMNWHPPEVKVGFLNLNIWMQFLNDHHSQLINKMNELTSAEKQALRYGQQQQPTRHCSKNTMISFTCFFAM